MLFWWFGKITYLKEIGIKGLFKPICMCAKRELVPLKALSFSADHAGWHISEIIHTFVEIPFPNSPEEPSSEMALHTGALPLHLICFVVLICTEKENRCAICH